jgi:hypothetical protein
LCCRKKRPAEYRRGRQCDQKTSHDELHSGYSCIANADPRRSFRRGFLARTTSAATHSSASGVRRR